MSEETAQQVLRPIADCFNVPLEVLHVHIPWDEDFPETLEEVRRLAYTIRVTTRPEGRAFE